MLALLLTVATLGPVEVVWSVDRPLADVAGCVQQHAMSAAAHLPTGLLTAQGAEDLGRLVPRLRADYRPAEHYLWARADLTPLRLTGSTTIEAWGRGPRTVFRLRTELSGPRNGPICRLIARLAERAAVDYERQQIAELTKKAR